MEGERQTLSFSIINILGMEAPAGTGKPPRLINSGIKEGKTMFPSSPSNSSSHDIELHSDNKLETVLNNKDASDNEAELYVEKSHTKRPGRMRFTPSQIQALEKRFQKQHYLLPADRKFLAKSLHMTERQVKTWFQNKRAQYKRTRPLVRNPVYHHPGSSVPLTFTVPRLNLLQTRPLGINIHLPGLSHPASVLHHSTSPPITHLNLTAFPTNLPMPTAYIPVPVAPTV